MKIALLTDGIYPYVMGGMQKHSYSLAKYFAKEQIQVDLYHFIPESSFKLGTLDSFFTGEELQYINVICLSFPKVGKFPGHYIYANYLYSKNIYSQLIKRPIVDFIYAKGFTAWYLLKVKSKGVPLPPVGVNFHGLEMFQQAPSYKVQLQLSMLKLPVLFNLRHSDYTFSYGGKITDILKQQQTPSKKIIEIPTGISEQWLSESPAPYSSKVRSFVFVGRFERRKGIEELNEVIHQLLPSYKFIVNFIGPIPPEKQIQSDKIKYWGSISDQNKIQSIIRKNDILLCPSHSEGMPNVIMEGLASGLAVIATDVGAIREMVSCVNGWLIPAADKEALKEAIISAIYLPNDELNNKKKAAIELVKERFTWDKVIKTTLNKISSIVKNK